MLRSFLQSFQNLLRKISRICRFARRNAHSSSAIVEHASLNIARLHSHHRHAARRKLRVQSPARRRQGALRSAIRNPARPAFASRHAGHRDYSHAFFRIQPSLCDLPHQAHEKQAVYTHSLHERVIGKRRYGRYRACPRCEHKCVIRPSRKLLATLEICTVPANDHMPGRASRLRNRAADSASSSCNENLHTSIIPYMPNIW